MPKQAEKRKAPSRRLAPASKKAKAEKAKTNQVPPSDHNYCASSSSSAKKITQLSNRLTQKNKVIRRLRSRNLRQAKTLKALIDKLKQFGYLSENCSSLLKENFEDLPTDLIKNEFKNKGKTTGARYDDNMKTFAVTLYFYSPRAYKFVRKTLSLPAPSTIRLWAGSVDVQPGFMHQVISSLGKKMHSRDKDCVLILDEMAIKSQTIWDQHAGKLVGTVDYGSIQAEGKEEIARNALVVMAAGLRASWQEPVAYFFTASSTADVQTTIITEAITILTQSGLRVHGVTFDGTSKNLTTAKKLGCDINNCNG